MMYINEYEYYQSSSNIDIIRKISRINERFGTPQILKKIFDDVYVQINYMMLNNIKKKSVHLNGSYTSINGKVFDFDKTIDIELNDMLRVDIHSKSFQNKIIFSFNFNSHDVNELKKVILHELLHIYEIYFRIKNKKTSLQWSINNILNSIENEFASDWFLNNLIYLIYLSFDHEIGARVCETYMSLIDKMSSDKNILLDELKKSSAWKYKEILSNFEIKNINYNNLLLFLIRYNTLINSKHNINNKIFRVPNNIKDCKIILNEYIRLFEKKSKKFENKLIKVVDDVLFDVNMINMSTINEFSNFEIDYPVDLIRESKIRKLFRENF